MADTRFIIGNLRQLLIRLNDHHVAMPRTLHAPEPGDPDGILRSQRSFVHGLALVALRQAMFDIFEAHVPDGDRDWSSHFGSLLRDFDVAALPIGDDTAALPGKAVPASSGIAVYAGAACFVGIMATRYAPSQVLGQCGFSPDPPPALDADDGMKASRALLPTLVAKLQTEGLLEETSVPFLDLVQALSVDGDLVDLVDIAVVWDRRVSAFTRERHAAA